MLIFTYLQVMPAFLDFVFSFGRQQYAQDFHFGGFRSENSLDDDNLRLKIPEFGRSGRDFNMCYMLKAAERSDSQRNWEWSLRQTAVYHSFDVESGKANWIIIKSDQLMKSRIKSATTARSRRQASSFQTVCHAFASSLATHLIMCDWAGENWRWYINYMEGELQNVSRRTLSLKVAASAKSALETSLLRAARPHQTQGGEDPPSLTSKGRPAPSYREELLPLESRQLPPEMPPVSELSNTSAERDRGGNRHCFSFSDLQRIHYIEEKANEAILILRANTKVLVELKQHYRVLADSPVWPEELSQCDRDIVRFEKRMHNIENEFEMQQSRVEILLRLIADRKELVCPKNLLDWSISL